MNIRVKNLDECTAHQGQGFKRISIFNPANTLGNHISLEYVILPKGAESTPHAHLDTHTVVFTLQGSVRLFYGDRLEQQKIVGPEGCVYIPPNVIHYVVNEHDEDMIAVVARTPYKHQIREHQELLDLLSHESINQFKYHNQ